MIKHPDGRIEGTAEEIGEYERMLAIWDVFAIDDKGRYRLCASGISRGRARVLCGNNNNYRAYTGMDIYKYHGSDL